MKLSARNGRAAAYALALALGLAVAAMGYISSYDNLSNYARAHDWAWPPALPIGLDLGIPALLILDWLRASIFLRSAAWVLAIGTVAANGAVAGGGWTDRLLHALMPALAIVIIEAARHLRDDPTRMDKIRLSRWLLSPIRTGRLWRRMVLWEVTSYSEALARESAILHARTALAAHYRRTSWRRTKRLVPLALRHLLATGQLPATVLHSLDQSVPVREWVEATLADLTPAAPEPEPEPLPVPGLFPGTGADQVPDSPPDPAAVDRAQWELMWVLQDRIRPAGIDPELFASAIAVARREYEQEGTLITNVDLRVRLRTGKPKADAIGNTIRSAFESGPVLADQTSDQPPGDTTRQPGESSPVMDGDGPGGPMAVLNGAAVGGPSLSGSVPAEAGEF